MKKFLVAGVSLLAVAGLALAVASGDALAAKKKVYYTKKPAPVVTKLPPPPTGEQYHFDIAGTVKDVFAILSTTATVAFLIYQVKK